MCQKTAHNLGQFWHFKKSFLKVLTKLNVYDKIITAVLFQVAKDYRTAKTLKLFEWCIDIGI